MNNERTHLSPRALTSQLGCSPVTFARRWSRGALAALLLVAAPHAANASTSAVTRSMTFPTLSVASDGDHYTTTEGFASGWEARFLINAGGAARVENWTIYPKLRVAHIPGFAGIAPVDLSAYHVSQSYPFGHRPKDVDRTVGKVFPNEVVSSFAAAVCNRNLENLVSQGLSKQQVLAQDRDLVLGGALDSDLDFNVTFGQVNHEISIFELEITCRKSPFKPLQPGAGGLTTTTRFQLDNATLDISPSQYQGACPKDLALTMEVQGNRSGMFEARVESTAGWKSTKIVLETNEFDPSSGLWGREFTAPFALPVQYPVGGGGIGPGPGELAPNPGTDSEPPSGGGIQTVGGLTGTSPGWNVHQQSLRLAATANGETVYSAWQQYRVTCDPKPAIGTPSGDLAPGIGGSKPPKPPTPTPTPAPQPQSAPSHLETKTSNQPSASSTSPPSSAQSPTPTGAKDSKKSTVGEPGGTKSEPPKSGKDSSSETSKPVSRPPLSHATPGGDGKPDLQVLEARASASQLGAIEFLVGNTGTGASTQSTANLSCGGRIGASRSWEAPLPAIPAGGQEWIRSAPDRQRTPRSPEADCTITLDPKNRVPETDEGNNRHSCKDCQAGR